jgi:hypothetical protein
MFKKSDLKTGMFGRMSDGDIFVIVNDLIVYQTGYHDAVSRLSDDMKLWGYDIDILVEGVSFMNAKHNIENRKDIIWERNPPKKTPTMKEVFYERNPNAPHDFGGEPKMCLGDVDESWKNEDCLLKRNCTCIDCWNRPIPNAEEVV